MTTTTTTTATTATVVPPPPSQWQREGLATRTPPWTSTHHRRCKQLLMRWRGTNGQGHQRTIDGWWQQWWHGHAEYDGRWGEQRNNYMREGQQGQQWQWWRWRCGDRDLNTGRGWDEAQAQTTCIVVWAPGEFLFVPFFYFIFRHSTNIYLFYLQVLSHNDTTSQSMHPHLCTLTDTTAMTNSSVEGWCILGNDRGPRTNHERWGHRDRDWDQEWGTTTTTNRGHWRTGEQCPGWPTPSHPAPPMTTKTPPTPSLMSNLLMGWMVSGMTMDHDAWQVLETVGRGHNNNNKRKQETAGRENNDEWWGDTRGGAYEPPLPLPSGLCCMRVLFFIYFCCLSLYNSVVFNFMLY